MTEQEQMKALLCAMASDKGIDQQFNMFVEKLRHQLECAKLHGDQYETALWMAISYVSMEAIINHA